MTPSLPLASQVVVVTGASSGIGLLIARSAARRGARVLLIARSQPALARIVQEIRAEGYRAVFAVADVGDAAALEAAADEAVRRYGQIDCWVNCAGVAIYAKLLETPEDEHRRLFETNYFGVVHGCRAALKNMQIRGGRVITIGSIASDMPSPILGAYSASKHAVKAYIESLRIELLADHIPVTMTLIKPAGMATPIGIHAANHLAGEALVPPPAYDPQLVADAVIYCAEHNRRELTVGGIGRAQTLLAAHFPRAFERFAPLVVPLLYDTQIEKTGRNALWNGFGTGQARSSNERGLKFDPYTLITLKPRQSIAIGLGLASAAILGIQAWCKRYRIRARR